jgi:hypothetical protein
MAETHIINWGKAKLSPAKEKPVVALETIEPIPDIKAPSLLQRFRTKLKRARLH